MKNKWTINVRYRKEKEEKDDNWVYGKRARFFVSVRFHVLHHGHRHTNKLKTKHQPNFEDERKFERKLPYSTRTTASRV